eukprot:CAMPEP_0202967272 /NCGR_PEP_ID=MMETSP1396-20130829/12082_1 /ASSEMBLY_ACC=CAM_ASM_000872 /TAXON_ID= /ORGANISM="Pseudokeronopsis sp., Strain Brazil" /LENGTH=57 /DNA_ID=CAMNT_0049692143 /DNA_START=132 /DNA_END=305 /DNA_ORIENTATION=-
MAEESEKCKRSESLSDFQKEATEKDAAIAKREADEKMGIYKSVVKMANEFKGYHFQP